jgi:diguanylate cyclase (GGDEF)-like protein
MRLLNSFHLISLTLILICVSIIEFGLLSAKIILSFRDATIGLILIAMIISVFFARSKPFVLLFLPLFFMFYMFYPSLLGLDGGNYSFWYISPIAFSLGFLLIGTLQERGLFSFYGLSKVLIIVVFLLIIYYLVATFSVELRVALNTSIINFDISPLSKLNDFSFLISIVSVIFVTLTSLLFFSSTIEKAPLWVLISLLIPAYFFQNQHSFVLFCALSAVLIIFALIKDAYTMSYIDTLTGIPGRHALEEAFLKLGSTYCIAMADIDCFKKFNDKYGHDVGDDALKLVAEQLKEVKGGGEAFRYGGEEFTILFPNKTAKEALPYLEEVRESITKRGFTLRSNDRPEKNPEIKAKLTISIGLASATKDKKSPKDVLKMSDNALYKAKEAGRNCVKSS